MAIVNMSDHPDVRFFEEGKWRSIGSSDDAALILIGEEEGTGADVVAKSYSNDFRTEELFAIPLYELLAHSYGAIRIDR